MKKIIILICLSVVLGVSAFFGINYYLNIPKDPEKIIDEIATSYYENYVYTNISKAYTDEAFENKMDEYSRTGIQNTLFDLMDKVDHEDKHLLMNSSESRIDCDFFKTIVKYEPVAPYGIKDYKYDLTVSCEILK